MNISLLCGGPSLERGISLNSARSVLDHLDGDEFNIHPFYFDHKKKAYSISRAQLYSNTPSDFDFKLEKTAIPLTQAQLISKLKKNDISFPAMHGFFGEDGGIQSLLEQNNLPFIGTSAAGCKRAFDKYKANEFIKQAGFFTLPSIVLKIYHNDHKKLINDFFKKHNIERAVVKPATGGSSIGVFSVNSPEQALEKTKQLFSKRLDTRVVIEPFVHGIEFTVILLENRFRMPVALIPTEIETDYRENQIFDFRKKYLPTRQVNYHCPPRFENSIIEKIQIQAEQLFKVLGMRDFARFDGWLISDNNIWFSDFNPISGMEQNSFIFQQSSRIGFSHGDVLKYIVSRASARYGIDVPKKSSHNTLKKRKSVRVLFGGSNSERQVSLMSGTNVWLKLKKSDYYKPTPYILDPDGNTVWKLPYALTLNHTVEEIIENCKKASMDEKRLHMLEAKVISRLSLAENERSEKIFLPRKKSLLEFIKESKFVFIALHGGIGENGELQKLLSDNKVKFNGPGESVSRICMDKLATLDFVERLKIPGISVALHKILSTNDLYKETETEMVEVWKSLCNSLNSKSIIAKPRFDGCSSGVVHLYNSNDLFTYVQLLLAKANIIPKDTLKNQPNIIELPTEPVGELLFEKYIETDIIKIKNNKLKYVRTSGWLEITVGVVKKSNIMHVFNPSITVSSGDLLTVEEKFQGGTGVNITPPPKELVKPKILDRTKELINSLLKAFKLEGYSRLDAFMNLKTGSIILIEINTLPGLTPSTVLYHQALAENPSIYPKELLEMLVRNKGY